MVSPGYVPRNKVLFMISSEPSIPSANRNDSGLSALSCTKAGCRSECSWFGFKIAVKPQSTFSRTELAQELDRNQIGNRMLFGGNLVRQPAFVQLRQDRPEALRLVGDLADSDQIMNTTLFLGTYPGLTAEMLKVEIGVIQCFAKGQRDG